MRSFVVPVTVALALAFAVGAGPSVALADSMDPAEPAQNKPASVTAELLILHATNQGKGIDPRVGNMPELTKPPFSAYNSYQLLDQTKLTIQRGTGTTYKLATGSELMVAFKDVIEGKPQRFVISANVQKPAGKSVLPLLEVSAKLGEIFFVAGEQYKGGILVIGIRITP